MSLQNMTRDELLELVKDAVSASVVVHPLTPEEIHWVRLAIKAEVERAEFRRAVIQKTLAGLLWAGLVGIGVAIMHYLQTVTFK